MWIVENSSPSIGKINKINAKNYFDFSTVYTKIPHRLLTNVLYDIIDFVFNGKQNTVTDFQTRWSIGKQRERLFDKGVSFFSHFKMYFTVGNVILKEVINYPIDIGPATFWANLILYFYENKTIVW